MLAVMSLAERVTSLEVEIEGYELERRRVDVSSEFTRVTTTVVMRGRGEHGVGEDVTYTGEDHDGFPESLPLAGSHTVGELSRALDRHELFAGPPRMEVSTDYRRWAFESAALDLALRQAGLSLGAAVGRVYAPVRFVASTRGDAFAWLAIAPGLELKLDPEAGWERPHMERLAATGRVRVLDLKAYYRGAFVGLEPDARLYRDVAEVFPDAVIEDAWLRDGCREALAGAEDRLSFDAPIHSLADVDALPLAPRWLNVKPSRFGTLARLLECIEACEQRGIRMYGGGQFELGPGRRQLQVLASLFYPDGPNDVAPSDYNEGEPRPGLPSSPLPPPEAIGF
jgi:L-alanine-DL-glutamate epimerase-like enolase superfamily enzyme